MALKLPLFICCVCTGVLPAGMPVLGCQVLDLQLCTDMWVLESKPSSPEEQSVLSPTEPSLQSVLIDLVFFVLFFRDMISLCSTGCPETHSGWP